MLRERQQSCDTKERLREIMMHVPLSLILIFFCSIARAEEYRDIKMGSLLLPSSCDSRCFSEPFEMAISTPPAANGFLSGEVTIDFKGKSYTSSYKNGFVTAGSTVIPRMVQGKPEVDIFTGTYSSQIDAIWGNTVYFFDKGIYNTYSGAVFDGQFYATTSIELATANGAYTHLGGSTDFSPSMVASIRKRGEEYVRPYNKLNILFVGSIEYKGRKQVGVFAQRDYSPGDILTLSKSNQNMIANFAKEQENVRDLVDRQLQGEFIAEQRRYNAKINNTIPWGKIFAISAGAVMAESSGLDSAKKSEFLLSYSKDVLTGSNNNISALQKKYSNNESASDILSAFNRSARDLSNTSLLSAQENQNQYSTRLEDSLNDSDCASMRINLDTLASTTDPQLQAHYTNWQKDYEQNCKNASSRITAQPSYFSLIDRIDLERCEETSEVQIGMICSNAMAHYYEYRTGAAKGIEQSTLDGLYKAHSESAKLYIHAIERLKTQ